MLFLFNFILVSDVKDDLRDLMSANEISGKVVFAVWNEYNLELFQTFQKFNKETKMTSEVKVCYVMLSWYINQQKHTKNINRLPLWSQNSTASYLANHSN